MKRTPVRLSMCFADVGSGAAMQPDGVVSSGLVPKADAPNASVNIIPITAQTTGFTGSVGRVEA